VEVPDHLQRRDRLRFARHSHDIRAGQSTANSEGSLQISQLVLNALNSTRRSCAWASYSVSSATARKLEFFLYTTGFRMHTPKRPRLPADFLWRSDQLRALWNLPYQSDRACFEERTYCFEMMAIVVAGAISALAASLFLINQHNLKRMWAYSSIENVGIMLVAIGIGSGSLSFYRRSSFCRQSGNVLASGNVIR